MVRCGLEGFDLEVRVAGLVLIVLCASFCFSELKFQGLNRVLRGRSSFAGHCQTSSCLVRVPPSPAVSCFAVGLVLH